MTWFRALCLAPARTSTVRCAALACLLVGLGSAPAHGGDRSTGRRSSARRARPTAAAMRRDREEIFFARFRDRFFAGQPGISLGPQFGRSFDPTRLRLSGMGNHDSAAPPTGVFQLSYGAAGGAADAGRPLAIVWADRSRSTLKFDLEVQPAFRRLGLYGYMLATFLARNPGIRYIPSQMDARNSDNAKIFFGQLARARLAPRYGEDAVDLDERSVQRLRAAILTAYQRMPSTIVRNGVGFARVDKIIVDPTARSIAFLQARGPSRDAEHTRIFLIGELDGEDVPFELTAQGRVRRSSQASLRLADLGELR